MNKAALKLVLKTAEASANGHENAREILDAVAECRKLLKPAPAPTPNLQLPSASAKP